jgi:hypothetical protein
MDACPDDAVHGCFYPSTYLTPADFLSFIVIGIVVGLVVLGARFALAKAFKRRRR